MVVPVTSITLLSHPASARRARRWLTPSLQGWGNEVTRHNATLLLSEVVTNAVRHAHGGVIRIAVTLSRGSLLAQVHDDSPQPPHRRASGETGGWGLALLDNLSTRWGVALDAEDGNTVWFEVHGTP